MTAPRIPRRASAYIPAGCNEQGRLPRTGCFIQAGEAATDLGADDSRDFKREARIALLRYLVLCVLLAGATALVIYGGQL